MAREVPLCPFQVLIRVDYNDLKSNGLIIPSAMRKKLATRWTNVQLYDSNNKLYVVAIDRSEPTEFRLCRLQWSTFVSTVLSRSTSRLCLRLLGGNRFEVICFDEDGLEYTRLDNGRRVVNRSLVNTTDHCLIDQPMNPKFLSIFNVAVREDRSKKTPPTLVPTKEVKLIGPIQGGVVDVIYKLAPSQREWIASGFNGRQWTQICMDNNIFIVYHHF